jgi:hypothetical protein
MTLWFNYFKSKADKKIKSKRTKIITILRLYNISGFQAGGTIRNGSRESKSSYDTTEIYLKGSRKKNSTYLISHNNNKNIYLGNPYK